MDLGLKGKTALITGSTGGIGLATAAALAREGAHVFVNGRTSERVKRAKDTLRERVPGARVDAAVGDVATAEGAASIVRAAPAVDILVNNAGIFEPKAFVEITDDDWRRFFETNVLGGVRLSRAYFPQMLERDWGRIVFVSSESGVQIPAEMIHYGMTKTAELAVARGLAELTTGTGVTVNSVLPGPTRSEGVDAFVKQTAAARGIDAEAVERDFFVNVRPSSLLKRFATVDEVANMIAYVCSAAASATNGAALRVDGGVVRAVL
ncbi:MAG: SDR family oxidoreductase [Myxococcota bacterium]|nr:SDR family oxidoreductase [Myxococcota bacterium]